MASANAPGQAAVPLSIEFGPSGSTKFRAKLTTAQAAVFYALYLAGSEICSAAGLAEKVNELRNDGTIRYRAFRSTTYASVKTHINQIRGAIGFHFRPFSSFPGAGSKGRKGLIMSDPGPGGGYGMNLARYSVTIDEKADGERVFRVALKKATLG